MSILRKRDDQESQIVLTELEVQIGRMTVQRTRNPASNIRQKGEHHDRPPPPPISPQTSEKLPEKRQKTRLYTPQNRPEQCDTGEFISHVLVAMVYQFLIHGY